MSTIYHDAFVVTGSDDNAECVDVRKAHLLAQKIGLKVTDMVHDRGIYASFLICPDGWQECSLGSDDRDIARAKWKAEVTRQELLIDWAHVRYGGDYRSEDGRQTADLIEASITHE